MRYLLDTTFLIDCLRGGPMATARFEAMFEAGDELVVNEVVVCELATGAHRHPDPDLLALLEPLEFVQPGPNAALIAGEWRNRARANGRTLSLADALIAAAAATDAAIVVTRNLRDFALTEATVEPY